jgi:hypothetical protein
MGKQMGRQRREERRRSKQETRNEDSKNVGSIERHYVTESVEGYRKTTKKKGGGKEPE